MQPHSHGNHGFPFGINGYYVSGLVELQQSQHPQYNEPQQPQYHPQQHQQQWQGHIVPFLNPHVHASSILSYPTFDSLFQKQVKETNQFINNQSDKMKLLLQQHQRELQLASQQIMTRKKEEIAKAAKKTQELEKLVRRFETENTEFEKIVKERETTIITLHNKLEEEKKKSNMFVENDTKSCCDESEEAGAEPLVPEGIHMNPLTF
ncbi:hypothetical protein MTR_2g066790 [Medicago truncatula]|uniref:Uncharacterized protein n=1 Tax=Medicago truncatula TaxID=3880 RepID=A0A072VA41_MEDTR|nr:hypothetical protein MTR_2g066790 [Medicago truncatula]